jgi:8-oxo-dGTP pyrophosphatase MutT (NUDIX family)
VGPDGGFLLDHEKEMSEPEAAVAIVHALEPEESTLLMRRSEREGDSWSGHWSFPGGRREPADEDLLATALRELEEECGVRLDRAHLAAALPEAVAGRRVGRFIEVAPFLLRIPSQLAAVPAPEEAVEAVWIPLALLRDPARHVLRPVPRLPADTLFPAIDLNGAPLWGFTYRVLVEWLGLCPRERPTGEAGFAVANRVLEFLLSRGLKLESGWSGRVARLSGPIPAGDVLEQFSLSGCLVPAVSRIEVRPDHVRVTGHLLEEYLIRAAS